MPTLDLKNQNQASNLIKGRIDDLKTMLEERKPFWDRMPFEKRRQWLDSQKDPVMNLAVDIYVYLRKNIFYEEGIING